MAKTKIALPLAQLGEAEAVPHDVAVNIAPMPPHLAMHGKAYRCALIRIERRQERVGGGDHRLHGGAGRAQRKQISNKLPVGGEALEVLL